MDPEHFPHAGAEKEFYWRDIYFANYHINHDKLNWLKYFDVADAHRLVEDFDRYDAGDWIITTDESGSGSASEQLIGLPCGWLMVLTSAGDDDYDELVTPSSCWCFIKGYPTYFELRGKAFDGLNTDLWFGFLNLASLFTGAATYGAYFYKPGASRYLYFAVLFNGVETLYPTGWEVEDLGCGRASIHWDGAGNLRWFLFEDTDAPQMCFATGTVTVDIPDNIMFYAGFGIRNDEAESNALYIDYLKVAMKRVPCEVFEHIEFRGIQE
jgi:hypothetical protein